MKRSVSVRIFAALLVVFLTGGLFPQAALAEDAIFLRPFSATLYVNSSAAGVRAYHGSYENNIYLSLYDLSMALDGSEKQFSIVYGKNAQDGEYHTIRTGEGFLEEGSGITPTELADREDVWLVFKRNRLFVDGADRKYYTCREGGYDLFMNLVDVQLMLDLDIQQLSNDVFRINPQGSFTPDYLTLQSF